MTPPPLVAVAHGSRDPAAASATRSLLAAVRRERPGLSVLEAYLDHEQPRLADLARAQRGTFVVVPLLLGAAYHSRVDIPAALAPAAGEVGQAVQADVLGPDPLLLAALDRRLAEAGVRSGDPDTAVVLAAAGSTDESSIAGIRELADQWRAAGWWDVRAAFASAAAPPVPNAVAELRSAGAPRVAVASYLLFPGLFVDSLADAGADVTADPLTDAPEVVRLVLARYDAATAEAGLDVARKHPTAPHPHHL